MTTRYWCEWAWLPDGISADVRLDVDDLGQITRVSTRDSDSSGCERLPGIVLPGMANTHSHAFHRALRGDTGGGKGTFWTWREKMYRLAAKLDPDAYYRLATAVYSEMAMSGITCVGEFHYLHHPPGGGRYADPNEMTSALIQAATDAGIRLTLLDTCYLSGGFGASVEGAQLRYADDDVQDWADRVNQYTVDDHRFRLGAALHSVRAVPVEAMSLVRDWAREREAPLHLHLSEQRAENEQCLYVHGCTPTQLLETCGILGAGTTAVHATHLAATDVTLLGNSGTGVCLCPTTEADLADGIGPADALTAAGSSLSVGTDGHSAIDPFAEIQAVENTTRLATRTRGHFGSGELVSMATISGYRALGWADAGWIGVGARADLVAVDLSGVRLAGVPPTAVPAHASATDVRDVLVGGRRIVRDRVHQLVPDVASRLNEEITRLR